MSLRLHPLSQLDITRYIRAGDLVSWEQAMAEPRGLLAAYLAARHSIGPTRAFAGLSLSGDLKPVHCDAIKVLSYGALGSTAALVRQDLVDLYPCRYAQMPALIRQGQLRPDVLLLQLSPPGPDGRHSLGFNNDLLPIMMQAARVVLAEVNPTVPWVHMDTPLEEARITAAFHSDAPLPQFSAPLPGTVEQAIAAHLADYIPEGATLQYGVGAVPTAILQALRHHRDLGLHSGLVTDDIIELIACGALTNAHKELLPGCSVGGVAMGSARLSKFLDSNPDYLSCSVDLTHSARSLSQLRRLVAINSALEVDLYGQVNAEQIGTRYLGAIGGQVDFMHAAAEAEQGLAVIALPAGAGEKSRIVSKLSGPQVTTARSEVDLVATEHGVADLRGLSTETRAAALIKIAAPEARDRLRHAWQKEANHAKRPEATG